MAILRIQGNARGTGTNNTSFTVTQSQAPANGNANILCLQVSGSQTNPSITSIVQTDVTWSLVKPDAYCGGNIYIGIVGAGAGTLITINLSGGTGTFIDIADVCEYSGIDTSSYLDKTASNYGYSAAGDTGTTATTTQANELWIGCIAAGYSTSGAVQSSPTNGFTLLDGAELHSGSYYGSTAYLEKIVSATGQANSGTTISYSNYWSGLMATFKAAAAGVAHYQTCSEIVGVVDGKSTKTAFHKTLSEVVGIVDDHDKNKCPKCKPSSVILTF